MSNDIAIRVENLSKRYEIYATPRDRLKQFVLPQLQRLAGQEPKQYFRDFWALKDVSFEVKKGETVGIIGRNGSGKSTLLQMICGTLSPTNGSIQTSGRIAALLELGSGFNPEFTGRENVYMNASVLGLSNEEIDTRFDEIVAFADIGDFIEQPVKTYSSGMMVRLAFAVIAHVDADILVVDEALAVGDAFFTQKCMRFLRSFMKNGTVLFVSHDTSAVINLCSHGLLLDEGKLKAFCSPKDVTDLYLDKLYKSFQDVIKLPVNNKILVKENIPLDFQDMRRDFINSTCLRNDIEVIEILQNKNSFGTGACSIENVSLEDYHGRPLSWIVGGEIVKLKIISHTLVDTPMLLFGFIVKDRLGQNLFGDNSHLSFIDNPLKSKKNEFWIAQFTFRMPVLPRGDYSIDVAVGNGIQENSIIHQWIHDAFIFRSHTSSSHMGLIGIPMLDISANLAQIPNHQ